MAEVDSLHGGPVNTLTSKSYKENPMRKKKEVAQDIIKDMPKKKAKPKAKVANSGNQEQNQQSLSESQPRYKPLNDLGNSRSRW